MKRKLFLMLALAAILTACGSGSASEGSLPNETAAASETASDGLTIPLDSLSAQPLFIDWEQDGTPMQLIALLDGEQVRLAYNTCQSCAGSPYAYFEYKDGPARTAAISSVRIRSARWSAAAILCPWANRLSRATAW